MSGEQLATLAVVVTIVTGILTVFYMARQSSRESARLRQADLDRAKSDALAPLKAELAAMTADRNYHRQRADEAEAELRRPR